MAKDNLQHWFYTLIWFLERRPPQQQQQQMPYIVMMPPQVAGQSVNPNQAVNLGGQQQQMQPPPQQAPPPHGSQQGHPPNVVAPPMMAASVANNLNQNSYHTYAATTQGNPQAAGYPNTAAAPTQAIFYVSNVSIICFTRNILAVWKS